RGIPERPRGDGRHRETDRGPGGECHVVGDDGEDLQGGVAVALVDEKSTDRRECERDRQGTGSDQATRPREGGDVAPGGFLGGEASTQIGCEDGEETDGDEAEPGGRLE